MQAEVFKVKRQLLVRAVRFKTRYYFRLVGDNGEQIASSEAYTQKHNVTEVLDKYFSSWEVKDVTGEN
jgi:hypothetical protein